MSHSDFNFSNTELQKFKQDGFVHVKNLFPATLIEEINQIVNKSNELKKAQGVIFDNINGNKFLRYVPQPQISETIFNKLINFNLLKIVNLILQQEVYFSGIDLHCREACSEIPTPPHQDSYLACFKDGFEHLVTCYVSLTGMTKDSANLRFIKGSHLNPTIDHKKSLQRGFSSVIEEDQSFLSSDMLNNEEVIILEKGECVFFHSKTIHYTNQTSKPSQKRASAAIRITGYYAEYSDERKEIYKKNVEYNRALSIKEGLAKNISKPQHS